MVRSVQPERRRGTRLRVGGGGDSDKWQAASVPQPETPSMSAHAMAAPARTQSSARVWCDGRAWEGNKASVRTWVGMSCKNATKLWSRP